MQLSEHFESGEFEKDGEIPEDCIQVFEFLCQNILEPIRSFARKPVIITSGYRTPGSNAAAHGVPDSEHIATPEKCAADFYVDMTFGNFMSARVVFDWIRKNPVLPFHQVILEHQKNAPTIIHVSYNSTTLPERIALEGATHNASAYMKWECVAYELPSSTIQENA